MKRNYNMKKTISIKQFIAEFGQGFSNHMKKRLLELGARCILTRKDNSHILDLRHIEHIKYDSPDASEGKKEYAYGQLVMNEGALYFSASCIENDDVMQISSVQEIYDGLPDEEILFEEGIKAKPLDESKLDYVVDRILRVCPEVSAEHMAIIAKYSNIEAPKGKTSYR